MHILIKKKNSFMPHAANVAAQSRQARLQWRLLFSLGEDAVPRVLQCCINSPWCCVCSGSEHPAEIMSLIQTMPRIYSELTELTPKSLFPPLGLARPFHSAEWPAQRPCRIHSPFLNKTRPGRGNECWGERGRGRNGQTLTPST